jgi:hypothetical protein
MNILSFLLVVILAAVGYFAYTFVPYFIDYLNMKEVVKASALSWYAKEEEKAGRTRFKKGLSDKGVDYVFPEDCSFAEQEGLYVVSCEWYVDVYYPGTDYYKTLEFWATASADKRGGVELESGHEP